MLGRSIVVLNLLAVHNLSAAACVSRATGDWSSPATWTSCANGTPAGSDSATVSATHTVTYDSDIVHTQPITVHGTLRARGARLLVLNNTALSVMAGGAVTNTDGVFEIRIGAAHNQPNAQLNLLGSSENPVTLQGESAASYLRFTDGGFLRGGRIIARYVTGNNIGVVGSTNAFVPAFAFWLSGSGDRVEFTHCRFGANVGRLHATGTMHASAVFIVEDNHFQSSGMNLPSGLALSAIGAGGVRSVQRNWFGGSLGNAPNGGQWYDVTFRHNVVRERIFSTDSGDQPYAAFEWNLIQNPSLSTGAILLKAATSYDGPNYLHIHNNTAQMKNIRGLTPTGYRDITISGWIIEPGNTDTVGDIFMPPSPGVARTWVVEHNILLPNMNAAHSGQFVSLLGNANVTIAIRKNTFFPSVAGGESGGISYGETYAGHAGIISAIRSNLVVGNSSGYVFHRRNSGAVSDGAAAANVTHNGKYKVTGNGYADSASSPTQPMFSGGSPGANDVVDDPRFVDGARRITTWALARGYTTSQDYNTASEAAYEALKTNTAERLEDLLTWVRSGFMPQNPRFWRSAHDGGTIGAVSAEPLRRAAGVLSTVQ